jgi:polysaccharide biosynthesis transport protein
VTSDRDDWLQRIQAMSAPGSQAQAGAPPAGGGINSLLQTLRRRRRVALISAAAVTTSLGLYSLGERLFQPVYEGRFEMQIANPLEPGRNGSSTGGGSGGDSTGGVVEAIARSGSGTNLANMVRLLGSPLVIGQVADAQAVPLDAVMQNLRITLPEEGVNQVLAVSLRWPDPAKGGQILDALAKRYVAFSQEQRQQALDSGMRFLDQQAPDLLARVDGLQDELRAFRVRHGFLDPLAQSQSLQQSRDALAEDLRGLQQRQAQLESQARGIRAGRLIFSGSGAPAADQQLGPTGLATPPRTAPGEAAAATAGTNTPLAELQQIEKELATARATFHDRTPLVRSLLARRAQLRPVVQRQALDGVNAALLLNSAQQDELNRQILLLDQRFKASPQRVKQYETLQQRLNVARDSYASYIRARETYRLEQARSTSPWAVISPPRFRANPVAPDLGQGLLQALLLGATAGVGAALLRERTDPLLHTPSQLEAALGKPLLGVIPHLPASDHEPLAASIAALAPGESLALRESLRQLFAALRDLQQSHGARLLAITSTTAGEGRSTAVAALAQTLAELGQHVLVVDADLRLSNQHRLLGHCNADAPSPPGLADALDHESQGLESLIQPVAPHLDLLPAGRSLSDPARRLHSALWQRRLASLRALQHYDLILFDTPACELLSDAALLGPGLDGLLFLVGLGQVERHRAQQACQRLQRGGATVLAVLANQALAPSHLSDDGQNHGVVHHMPAVITPAA